MGAFYKAGAKTFIKTLAVLVKQKLFTSPTCEKEFVDVNCQMMRGSICSTDMSLRLFAISQQDCTATYTKWWVTWIGKKPLPVLELGKQMIKVLKVLEFGKKMLEKTLNSSWQFFLYLVFYYFLKFCDIRKRTDTVLIFLNWFCSCLTSLFKIHQSCNLNHFELTVYYKHQVLISHPDKCKHIFISCNSLIMLKMAFYQH